MSDVQITRIHPASHRLSGAAVTRVAHLDPPTTEAAQAFEARPAWQLVQVGAARIGGLVQVGDVLRAQPASTQKLVDVVW